MILVRRLFIIGMPGCKKASCAEELAKHFHWENINVGDLLRKEVSKKSERGARINECFKKSKFGKSCNRQYLNFFSRWRISDSNCEGANWAHRKSQEELDYHRFSSN